ncbi:hypothetical protein D9M68_536080 [compost metagenome]
MKGITYLLLFFSTICLTCKKPAENEKKKPMTCAEKPLELPWIKNLIADNGDCKLYGGAIITMYTSENETLFLLTNYSSSVGICNFVIYDCEGKRIGSSYVSLEDRRQFLDTHKNGIIIWQKN